MNRPLTRMPEALALNLLRIVAGFLFMQHGLQKLFGVLGRDVPVEFFSQMGLAGVLELVGGVLLVLGLFSRPVAFVLSGEMAWAYFQAHAPNGFWPIVNRGELAALYSFVFLYLAVRGGGSLSLDGLIAVRRRRREPGAGTPSGAPETEGPPEEPGTPGESGTPGAGV